MDKLVIASNNKDKIKEIKDIMGDRFELLSLNDIGLNIEPEETGKTFFENALIKAKAVYDACGYFSLSDDSGLCVDALNGAPGIYSARYAGNHGSSKDNNELLLRNMKQVTNRDAKFVCSTVLYFGDNNYLEGYGETCGRILPEPDGNGGFGYDPVFYSYELKKSFGNALAEEKNTVSHRKRAIESLIKKLKDLKHNNI